MNTPREIPRDSGRGVGFSRRVSTEIESAAEGTRGVLTNDNTGAFNNNPKIPTRDEILNRGLNDFYTKTANEIASDIRSNAYFYIQRGVDESDKSRAIAGLIIASQVERDAEYESNLGATFELLVTSKRLTDVVQLIPGNIRARILSATPPTYQKTGNAPFYPISPGENQSSAALEYSNDNNEKRPSVDYRPSPPQATLTAHVKQGIDVEMNINSTSVSRSRCNQTRYLIKKFSWYLSENSGGARLKNG